MAPSSGVKSHGNDQWMQAISSASEHDINCASKYTITKKHIRQEYSLLKTVHKAMDHERMRDINVVYCTCKQYFFKVLLLELHQKPNK